MNVQPTARNVNVPLQKDGKILYCAVLLHREQNGRKLSFRKEEIFTHADTVGEARWNVAHTITDHTRTRIIGIGPAVGVFAEDDNGDGLTL